MPTNDFRVFSGGTGANVQALAAYQASTAVATGFVSGVASSAAINRAIRQASIIATMIAQFTIDNSGANAVDDGTIATLEANFKSAVISAAGGGSASSIPYDISGGTAGTMLASQIIFMFVAVRTTTFPIALAGSRGTAGTSAASAVTCVVANNGTSVGTVHWAAGAATPTFTLTSALIMNAGDILTVTAPGTPDSALANTSFTFLGSVA
jgi:hypothetical protein